MSMTNYTLQVLHKLAYCVRSKTYQQPFLLRFAPPGSSRGVLGLPLDDEPAMQSLCRSQGLIVVKVLVCVDDDRSTESKWDRLLFLFLLDVMRLQCRPNILRLI